MHDFPRRNTAKVTGLGCLGIIVLVFIIFAFSVFTYAWIIMLVQGAIVDTGEWHMSYNDAIPWGVGATIVAGILGGGAVRT